MFSGGKDSTALLHKLITSGWNGKIIHSDTTVELPEHYEFLNWLEENLKIKIEIVKPKYNIDSWIRGTFKKGQNKGEVRGLPVHFGNQCHLRGTFKVNPINKYITKLEKNNATILLGFGLNEIERSKKYGSNYRFPLIEWNWTEEDCVKYLKIHKIPFPFFRKKRTGCYFCPQQNRDSLFYLWKNYPELWKKTKEYDKLNDKSGFPFDLEELEKSWKNNLLKYG